VRDGKDWVADDGRGGVYRVVRTGDGFFDATNSGTGFSARSVRTLQGAKHEAQLDRAL
jgi:hypothetical protein